MAPDPVRAEVARRDPRVGSGGVIALILVIGAEVTAIASLASSEGAIVAAATGRRGDDRRAGRPGRGRRDRPLASDRRRPGRTASGRGSRARSAPPRRSSRRGVARSSLLAWPWSSVRHWSPSPRRSVPSSEPWSRLRSGPPAAGWTAMALAHRSSSRWRPSWCRRRSSVAEPLVLALGGTRSGKSRFGLRRATELAGAAGRVWFLATALAGDPELDDRIARHRRERPATWPTVDVGRDLAAAVATDRADRADPHRRPDAVAQRDPRRRHDLRRHRPDPDGAGRGRAGRDRWPTRTASWS